jgi:NAD+ synthase (glutamine-hydrolysing)
VELGLEKLKKDLYGITIVIGHPSGQVREDLYNAASVIVDGQCLITYFKQYLPNYSVFDEERYFVKGNSPGIFECKGIKFGITICEDIWFKDPTNQAADHGAEVLLNLNASPYRQGKCQLREVEVRRRVAESGLPIVYVNQVGGQDELVFDGGSFVISANGQKVARAPAWREGLFPVNITRERDGQLNLVGEVVAKESDLEMIYRGLVVGLRDYIEKNDFPSVVIGLSGGIDSAMTLALAVDALGSDRVKTVMMPSKYTSQMSLDDAAEMASLLNVTHSIIPIDPITDQFNTSLLDHFYGLPADITEENIQARSRGVLLMALSNKTGAMVLSTGNKSEMAVGYSTLYGDMAGGFSPLKDVYKSLVYRLADYRNNLAEIIPTRIITRPPSAELADEQLDQDSLPAYEILDVLLEQYIANDLCYEEMVSIGNDPELIAQVIRLVDRNEYKRRQAPPGIRITDRAFGRDRRYPITSGYTINSKME